MVQTQCKLEYLELIKNILIQLEEKKINYCHWKSNLFLNKTAKGQNDLDLLIDIDDKSKFEEILTEFHCKASKSNLDFITPTITNYYGLDSQSGFFVNFHIHYLLFIGHDLSKNYHIPIEKIFLSSTKYYELFRIPSIELEWIIFIFRMVIKHLTFEAIILGQGNLSPSEKKEFEFLKTNVMQHNVENLMRNQFLNISLEIFNNCVNFIQTENLSINKVWIAQKMIKALEIYTRKPKFIDSFQIIWRRYYWSFLQKILHKDFRKHLSLGGKMIAIIGGDGAGKTTLVNELSNWLGNQFAVRKYHMGKPIWSILTILARGILKIGTVFKIYPFQQCEISYSIKPEEIQFPGYPWLIREILTARDRKLTYIKALNFSKTGGITILDRFPMQAIKLMDGPQIARMTINIQKNRFIKWIIKKEENYYKSINKPDLILLLKVDPQLAVQRKLDESEKTVRPRSEEIMNLELNDQTLVMIDASESKELVLKKVKELVWSFL